MTIPKIYEVDPVTGYTVDGLFLGIPKGPYRPMPDVYHHPGPLPQLKPTSVDMRLNTRTAMDHPSASKRAIAQRIASFDEKHAEEMRKFYGDPKLDPENDGARISWATKIAQSRDVRGSHSRLGHAIGETARIPRVEPRTVTPARRQDQRDRQDCQDKWVFHYLINDSLMNGPILLPV